MEPITPTGEAGLTAFVDVALPRLIVTLQEKIQRLEDPAIQLYTVMRLKKALEEIEKTLKVEMEPGETWASPDGRIAYQKSVSTKKAWQPGAAEWLVSEGKTHWLKVDISKIDKSYEYLAISKGLLKQEEGPEVVRSVKLEGLGNE